MEDLEGFDYLLLRCLGTVCHNRRCTLEEFSQKMDASTRRGRSWLARLKRLGLVTKENNTYYPTKEGWEILAENSNV